MQQTRGEIIAEIEKLTNKWKGKPEPMFMSKEYIERRFDRMRFRQLQKDLESTKKPSISMDEIEDLFKE